MFVKVHYMDNEREEEIDFTTRDYTIVDGSRNEVRLNSTTSQIQHDSETVTKGYDQVGVGTGLGGNVYIAYSDFAKKNCPERCIRNISRK